VMAQNRKAAGDRRLPRSFEASEALMVARAIRRSSSVEECRALQKQMTRLPARGKPVVIATQMLESMIQAPVPTRAEVSDVAPTTTSASLHTPRNFFSLHSHTSICPFPTSHILLIASPSAALVYLATAPSMKAPTPHAVGGIRGRKNFRSRRSPPNRHRRGSGRGSRSS